MLKKQLQTNFGQFDYFDISYFEKLGSIKIKNTPYTIRVLLENCLRNSEKKIVNQDHLNLLSSWNPEKNTNGEFPFMPGRVILQDFTGVPVAVDLAAMRDAVSDINKDPSIINPIV